LLCVVQGCERFAFFAMLPLFVLYLQQHLAFTEQGSVLLLGVFQALSYVGALPAGAITDRVLGRWPATLLGCALLTLGYGGLALDRPVLLWPALALMLSGHSFFKPGLNSLGSSLFGTSAARREHGFLLLHLAINIGAMVSPLCAEWSRSRGHWPGVFRWAAGAMLLGTTLLSVASLLAKPAAEAPTAASVSIVEDGSERRRWQAVRLICAVAVVYWLTAQQAGSSLVLFAEQNTVRTLSGLNRSITVGPGHFASLHSLLVLVLLPLLLMATTCLRRHGLDLSTPSKMAWGYIATAAAFALMGAACLRGGDTARVSAAWLTGCYIALSLAELLLAPLGLSLLTQLSPPQRTSQSVGLWFASTATGNLLAGILGIFWGRWPHHRYFAILTMLALGAATVLLARLRRIVIVLPR
jgi:POT family proton-dependent oligopeptide transporter